jgi:hypothetical protein
VEQIRHSWAQAENEINQLTPAFAELGVACSASRMGMMFLGYLRCQDEDTNFRLVMHVFF